MTSCHLILTRLPQRDLILPRPASASSPSRWPGRKQTAMPNRGVEKDEHDRGLLRRSTSRCSSRRTSSSSCPNLIGASNAITFVAVSVLLTRAGYTRIVLAFASLYYMPIHPRTCSILYSVSCLLDALDGLAARRYHQSTSFRRSPRHGHRSVHNLLPAGLPCPGLPTMEHRLPVSDQLGSCQPLHPHVRNLEDGW